MDYRERIKDKAFELFLRYGIRSVSMDDIAAQLGISKKTIYQYFSDKDELVEAVVVQDISRMQDDCARCGERARDAIDEIFIMMEQILEQFRNMNPMVVYDLEKFHPVSHRRFLKHKNEFLLELISANMRRGIREELYRSDVDIDVLSRYRLESMMIPFNLDVFPPKKYNLADVTITIMEHFVYGLATLKGHRLIQKYKSEYQKKIPSDEN